MPNVRPMRKIILVYGLISGAVLAAMAGAMAVACSNGRADYDKGEIVGYSAMVLAFLMVFFGIRSYRENAGGGAITFGKAFQVGILITLIACSIYVVSWEIVYFNFLPDFADTYAKHVVTKMQHDGASDAQIAAKAKEMEDFKRLYKNPAINVGMTFVEVFPVGLIMTLVSAAILRRKSAPPSVATAAA